MTGPSLDDRLAALAAVRELGGDQLGVSVRTQLDSLIERAAGRRSRSAAHTVVGLFGATGSGKSSLLNAVVGEDVATSHVRRPTTSEPLAVSWDPAGAADLLDWLEVRQRHSGEHLIDPRAAQLILLDLPDFDSVQHAHRVTAERLASQVDALIWVVDPQKYADAVLHADFIAPHSRHGAVTIVVLNQIDLLLPAEVPRVVDSLRSILAADGLVGVRVMATSARTGEGVPALRAAVGDLADARVAAAERLSADVSVLAQDIPVSGVSRAVGKSQAAAAARTLTAQLGAAAGVDVVAAAVAGSYRKRAGQATGWPLVSWLLRLRADPLARLGLRPRKGQQRDPELHRTSMPALSVAGKAGVSLAVRNYVVAASVDLTEPWRAAARVRGQDALEQLPAALDLAIVRAPLPTKGSWWWPLFGVLQWVSIGAALVGVGWMLLVGLLPPALSFPTIPVVEGWPVTTLLIAGGVLLGILLGLSGAAIAAAGAAARRRKAKRVLLDQVATVARDLVVLPVDGELARARRFDAAVHSARDVR